MCLPCAERVILSASEGPPQCPISRAASSFSARHRFFFVLALAGYTFLETVLETHLLQPSKKGTPDGVPFRIPAYPLILWSCQPCLIMFRDGLTSILSQFPGLGHQIQRLDHVGVVFGLHAHAFLLTKCSHEEFALNA